MIEGPLNKMADIEHFEHFRTVAVEGEKVVVKIVDKNQKSTGDYYEKYVPTGHIIYITDTFDETRGTDKMVLESLKLSDYQRKIVEVEGKNGRK